MTTGISTAAVPVFESTPLITPVMIIMAIISCFSDLAKCVTTPPILFAIPVSNSAPPTMNIATNRMTLLSTNPANAVFQSKHAGDDETDTDDHGCYAERNLLPDKHHDGKQQK